MAKQWIQPINESLMWPAIGMAGASVVALLVGGGLSELLNSWPVFWVALLLTAGLCAPCAGMVIGADTCRLGDSPLDRSTHGFVIGCSILGFCAALAVEVVVKLA
jgi:hypothetical protein